MWKLSKKLGASFYQQETVALAKALLGQKLVRIYEGKRLVGRIVEVEAYHQDGDEAAHSFRGKTPRNQVMFGPPGYLYVYFIYGMHYCMNVVSEEEGVGAAVLIRGLEPLEGIETMQALRGPKIKRRDLTTGPARACKAMAINRHYDGTDLLGDTIWLEEGDSPLEAEITCGPRIGISKSKDLPWRWVVG